MPVRLRQNSMLNRKQALVAFILICLLSPALAAEKREQRLLHVSGRGEVHIPSVYTEIQLGVELQAETASEAQKQVSEQTGRLLRFLKGQKVSDLQTTGISLQPVRESSKLSSGEVRRYVARNTVVFRVKTEKAGAMIDGAIKAGANRINGLTFLPEPSAWEEARKQALQLAVDDAKKQARAVLSVLNLSIKEIVEIDVQDVPLPSPQRVHMLTTPVIGGKTAVVARVVLHIRY